MLVSSLHQPLPPVLTSASSLKPVAHWPCSLPLDILLTIAQLSCQGQIRIYAAWIASSSKTPGPETETEEDLDAIPNLSVRALVRLCSQLLTVL